MSSTYIPSPTSYATLQDNAELTQVVTLSSVPTSSNRYNANTIAVVPTSNTVYMLTGYTSGSPNWALMGSSSGDIVTINTISPTAAGDFTIAAGTGVSITPGSNQITIGLTGGGVSIDTLTLQAGTTACVPTAAGVVTFSGAVTAAGTTPVQTNGTAANTCTLQIQTSQAIAATDATKIGLCNFNSTHFSVDANGFVELAGGGLAVDSLGVQAATGPGANPTVPTAAGLITIEGAVVAAGTVPIQTNAIAANALQVQVQTSQALAATDATKIGLCNFDSSQFAVDANGFTTLVGSIPVITKGTFLPNLEFGGSSTGITYATQTGNWVAIGTPGSGDATVVVSGFIVLTSKGAEVGNASISNLPYNCFTFQAIGSANVAQAITIDAGYAGVIVRANTASTSMDLIEQPAATSSASQILTNTNFADTSSLSFTIVYQA